jgi:hypothetical protein
MGRSFIIHPSVRKALSLVEEGGFELWCLGMVMILVVCEVMWCYVNREDMGGKFVGLGLNQGSNQRKYLFLEMCQKDEMRHEKQKNLEMCQKDKMKHRKQKKGYFLELLRMCVIISAVVGMTGNF